MPSQSRPHILPSRSPADIKFLAQICPAHSENILTHDKRMRRTCPAYAHLVRIPGHAIRAHDYPNLCTARSMNNPCPAQNMTRSAHDQPMPRPCPAHYTHAQHSLSPSNAHPSPCQAHVQTMTTQAHTQMTPCLAQHMHDPTHVHSTTCPVEHMPRQDNNQHTLSLLSPCAGQNMTSP
jgi:hypothetical protein